jgi:hypothetical protein
MYLSNFTLNDMKNRPMEHDDIGAGGGKTQVETKICSKYHADLLIVVE